MSDTIIYVVLALFVGFFIGAGLKAWSRSPVSKDSSGAPGGGVSSEEAPKTVLQVGDVYSYEHEGYVYYAIVRDIFVRRGCKLVAYQSWRDDDAEGEPKNPSRWFWNKPEDAFRRVFQMAVRVGGANVTGGYR